jgi:signal transduction histidine kinase
MRSRGLVVDIVLGLLLGWAGWTSAHLAWNRPPRMGRRGPWENEFDFQPVPDISPAIDVFLVLLVVGVAVRRGWPRTGFVLVLAGLTGYRALGAPAGPVYLALALGVFAMASALPLRRWVPLTAGLLVMVLAGHWREPDLGLLSPTVYAELLGAISIAILPAMFALLHRARRENERRAREQDRRRYADEERLRIAREVHDVVGHSLSVITMQAGVALHVLDKRPEPDAQLAESLEAIRRTSKDALAELRTTIGVFRDPDGGAPHGLRPGLDRLDDLVAALVSAGREVRVVREPAEQPALPAAVDQAAFRIVQEALTNVVRHAGSSAARVLINSRPEELIVEVSDAGPATRAPVAGNGIAGMVERARAVGGRVEFEPIAPHGLRVRALLPVGDDS